MGEFINSLGQRIEFVEHPLKGDEFPIIVICRELGLCGVSGFYDIGDMVCEHKEYEPKFIAGELVIGD